MVFSLRLHDGMQHYCPCEIYFSLHTTVLINTQNSADHDNSSYKTLFTLIPEYFATFFQTPAPNTSGYRGFLDLISINYYQAIIIVVVVVVNGRCLIY